jgi:DNA-binding protein YbaB
MDEMLQEPLRVAREAAHAARTLGEAAALTAQASSPDGLVRVVADGGGRVVRVDLDPRLLRDRDRAGPAVATVLDEALGAARTAGHEAALAALPPALRALASDGTGADDPDDPDGAWARRVAAARAAVAGRLDVEHTAGSPDGEVSVTVTGGGRVAGVLLRTATGPTDAAGLGALVTAAANEALRAAGEDVAAAAAGDAAPPVDTAAAVEAFSGRMDGLLARLDELSARLDRA